MQPYLIYDEARGERPIDAARKDLISTETVCAQALRRAAEFGDFDTARVVCEKVFEARRLFKMIESASEELKRYGA